LENNIVIKYLGCPKNVQKSKNLRKVQVLNLNPNLKKLKINQANDGVLSQQ
jgi:hypothetical protein